MDCFDISSFVKMVNIKYSRIRLVVNITFIDFILNTYSDSFIQINSYLDSFNNFTNFITINCLDFTIIIVVKLIIINFANLNYFIVLNFLENLLYRFNYHSMFIITDFIKSNFLDSYSTSFNRDFQINYQ